MKYDKTQEGILKDAKYKVSKVCPLIATYRKHIERLVDLRLVCGIQKLIEFHISIYLESLVI